MDKELLPFGSERLSPESLDRIVGLAVRKAGISMNEIHIADNEKRRNIRKRTASVIAVFAAAAVMTVSAGAVYTQFLHKAAVQDYFAEGTADYLENKGLALNLTDENEHIRLTVDTLLSDGHIGNMILTLEGLDEEGIALIGGNVFPEIYLSDAETGEYIPVIGENCPNIVTGGGCNFDTRTDRQITLQTEMKLDKFDPCGDYLLTFGARDIDSHDEERDEHDVIVNGVMEGITIETSFAPNVEVKELKSSDGKSLWLSQIGYYTDDGDTASLLMNKHGSDIGLLRKNSPFKDEIEFNARSADISPERGTHAACGWSHSIIEIERYEGMKIGDTEFIETE